MTKLWCPCLDVTTLFFTSFISLTFPVALKILFSRPFYQEAGGGSGIKTILLVYILKTNSKPFHFEQQTKHMLLIHKMNSNFPAVSYNRNLHILSIYVCASMIGNSMHPACPIREFLRNGIISVDSSSSFLLYTLFLADRSHTGLHRNETS